jgi:hypothetical protein
MGLGVTINPKEMRVIQTQVKTKKCPLRVDSLRKKGSRSREVVGKDAVFLFQRDWLESTKAIG